MDESRNILDEQDRLSEERSEEVKRLRDEDVEALKWLMGNKLGRRFMWRLLSMTGVFRNPWNPSSNATAFSCGMQAVGQAVLAELHEHCLERFLEMTKEHKRVGKQ